MRAPDVLRNQDAPETNLPWYWQVAAACAALAIIFSRQPSALLHAQFFAEDGRVWFADAYNTGWFVSLFRSQDGYFQTLPRLAAALALLVPLRLAPLVMNLCGLLVQILPVLLLLSNRLSGWGSLGLRAALAFTYLALPNSRELNVSIEEAQWHLALAACLLLLSPKPASRAWKIFDAVVLVLCGLTGPFAILLLPIAALRLWQCHDRFARWALGILLVTAVLQSYALLLTHRDNWPLGASVAGLIRILSGQIFLGAIVGSNYLGVRESLSFLVVVVIAGVFVVTYCFVSASREWKLLLLFCFMVLAAALRRPFTPGLPPGSTSWGVLAGAVGIRYWFLPMVAFSWTIVWYLFSRERRIRQVIGAALMAVMLIGWIRDWRIPPATDAHFASYAEAFSAAAPGTVVTIPIPPSGWSMRLVRR
jgi:hypothetical protein